ncbi:MAG: hypothetical protein [Microviridae sp.]|nr:MAG: hypothetical protein [Microviridae sp.]
MNRLPLLRLSPPRNFFGTFPIGDLFTPDRRVVRDQVRDISTPHSICQRRSVRRSVLFMNQIAGKGRRKSPGQGGHYRKTDQSEMSCHKVR